jgi:hypothetical protein
VITANESSQNLCQEALYWSQLDHQNILPLIGVIRNSELFNGRHCLIMPRMPNGTVSEYVEKNPEIDRAALVREIYSHLLGQLTTSVRCSVPQKDSSISIRLILLSSMVT